jgi:hypothetical protein
VVFVCCAAGKGATVIQLGGGTRELYYYPKNTMTVINVGANVNKGETHVRCWADLLQSCNNTGHRRLSHGKLPGQLDQVMNREPLAVS